MPWGQVVSLAQGPMIAIFEYLDKSSGSRDARFSSRTIDSSARKKNARAC